MARARQSAINLSLDRNSEEFSTDVSFPRREADRRLANAIVTHPAN